MALEHDFLMTSFYHYTTQDHLRDINESGVIKTVESNISSETDHAGPDVVWLFKDILQVVPRMLFTFLMIDNQSTSVMVPKCQVELTIGLDRDEVSRADKFMKRHKAVLIQRSNNEIILLSKIDLLQILSVTEMFRWKNWQ